MPDEVDPDLLSRFVQGDQDAFESLFRLFEAEVFGWILRIVRDHHRTEEALVDAFWRAYRGRAHFDCARSFGAWLRAIATNAALDQLRLMRRDLSRGDGGDVRSAIAPEADPRREAIRLAFRRLPPKLQAVATLVLVEGLSQEEAAQALGLPIGTVKSRRFRAIRALRKELSQLGIDL
jgi:RNA polymerase sigma factor (sigma-70 family)